MCTQFLLDRSAKPPPCQSYLAKSYKDAWMYADHFVLQLRLCWLRNVNKHTLKAGPGAPGTGHWLYALPTAPFTKVANGPFKWGLQHRLGLVAPGQATYVASNSLSQAAVQGTA